MVDRSNASSGMHTALPRHRAHYTTPAPAHTLRHNAFGRALCRGWRGPTRRCTPCGTRVMTPCAITGLDYLRLFRAIANGPA